jgi:hypothetical protein
MNELKPRIHKNGIDYILVGDYYVPDLKLPESNQPIGRWGRLHGEYLKNYRPARYSDLILSGKLWDYLSELDIQAQNRYDLLVLQLKEKAEISEELKKADQMAWVRQMNSGRMVAEEIVFHELIYC